MLFIRKLRVKKVVRMPAISMKTSDIPPDDFSWRKYGQKPIKGSPHPRFVLIVSSTLYQNCTYVYIVCSRIFDKLVGVAHRTISSESLFQSPTSFYNSESNRL